MSGMTSMAASGMTPGTTLGHVCGPIDIVTSCPTDSTPVPLPSSTTSVSLGVPI